MKKSILFVLLVTIMAGHLSAQITINRSHMTSSGQMTILATDFNEYPIPGNGVNYSWDFSNLNEDERDTVHYGLPQWYPGASFFPNANITSKYASIDSSYEFLTLTDNELTFEGSYDIENGTAIVNPFNIKYISFPSTFNTSFSEIKTIPGESTELGLDPDGPGPLPLIDSIYYDIKINNVSLIDGHGSIKTPIGTYSTIRQKMTTITDIDNIKMFANGTWSTVPKIYIVLLGLGSTADTSYRVAFWTNDNKIGQPLVDYSYRNRDTSISDITWVAAKAQASKLNTFESNSSISAFPNPCQNSFQVQFPNTSIVGLSIYDMNGRLINQYSVKSGDLIDISRFENGVYFLRFNDLKTGMNIGNQKLSKL